MFPLQKRINIIKADQHKESYHLFLSTNTSKTKLIHQTKTKFKAPPNKKLLLFYQGHLTMNLKREF